MNSVVRTSYGLYCTENDRVRFGMTYAILFQVCVLRVAIIGLQCHDRVAQVANRCEMLFYVLLHLFYCCSIY